MPKFAANLSMLFTEVDFLARFEAASEEGFEGVEFLFPYAYEADLLAERLAQNQLTQVLFNMPPGDWDAGERGIACHPDRIEEFEAGVEKAITYAKVLGCKQINCLAGIRPSGFSDESIEQTFINNIRYASEKLASHDIRLMIEAINSRVDMPGFWLDSSEKGFQLIKSLALPNLFLQYDIYHTQIMEGDVIRRAEANLPLIGHMQFADNPGRHEPGTGELNFATIFNALDKMGYRGWVSAEYRPKETTKASLSWFQYS